MRRRHQGSPAHGPPSRRHARDPRRQAPRRRLTAGPPGSSGAATGATDDCERTTCTAYRRAIASADDDLRAWLAAWGRCVASVDFEAASAMFDDAVVGFGTRADVAVGLEELRRAQWAVVWPSISGFTFDAENAETLVSADGTQGAVWTTWSSEGRRGRATIVLRHDAATGEWRGVHTHFSLRPERE